MRKRILSLIIVIVLSLGLSGFALEAGKITRAEAVLCLANAMGAANGAFLSEVTDIRPDEPVTREEAFDMLAKTVKLSDSTSLSQFADSAEVSPQYYGTIAALVSNNYIKGISAANGTFILNPKGTITRGEFAALLDSAFQGFVISSGMTTKVADGNIVVKAAGATLKDLTVMGDLIIADSVGDGEVTLDNVVVQGRLVIRGGGKNSINLKGASALGEVIVARTDGAVSVKVQDDSTVQVIYITDSKNDVVISGGTNRLVVQTADVPVTLTGGTVGSVTVAANNAEVTVASDSVIASLSVAAKGVAVDTKYGSQIALLTVTPGATNLDVTGNGTITKAVINASKASIENTPATTVVGGGVVGTEVAGDGLNAGSTTNLFAGSVENNREYVFLPSPLPTLPPSTSPPEPEPSPEPPPPEPEPSPEPPPPEPSSPEIELPPEPEPPIEETFTVTLNVYKDAATYTGYNKIFTLKNTASATSIVTGSGTDGIVTFTNVAAGTWSLFDGTTFTGKNITVTDKAEKEALYYSTLTFYVIDEGPAVGSSISSNQTVSTSPAVVLNGTAVKLTVVGAGKDVNIYSWTVGKEPNSEKGDTLTFVVSGTITISCMVIGID